MRHTPLFIACLLASCAPVAPPVASGPQQGRSAPPAPMADPFEGPNRAMWAMNCGILRGVLQPAGRIYRTAVPTPARKSIGHFSRNIHYPGRLVNHMLQGRWQGAGQESLRFLTNTTVGVAGVFDVASKWDIPKSDADFGQTFTRWGWRPNTYLMLPVFGPSDFPHALGLAANKALDPWAYLDSPYSSGSAATKFNELANTTESRVRFVKTGGDSYETTKLLWTHTSREATPDWTPGGAPDPATLETLAVATLATDDPSFAGHAKERTAAMPHTGRKLPFLLWLQPGTAPLAYVTPGLGSHRYTSSTLVLAERLYQNGFSVVAVSSMFHPEFLKSACTSVLPAYPPNDCRDLHATLTAIDSDLEKRHPGRIGTRALVGMSMGGFQALYLAATESLHDASFVRFSRYLAIDTPVNLQHGIQCLDTFCAIPDTWPADQRQARTSNIFAKGFYLASNPPLPGTVPFSADESKYLIGLSFRFALRDAIYSTQSRKNLGVIQTPLDSWHRSAAYREIEQLNYLDYFRRFVLPAYRPQGIGLTNFRMEANLRTKSATLGSQTKVRLIFNSNDFLLTPSDRQWLRSTFGPGRCTILPGGGHLGNMASPEVKAAITRAMTGGR